MFSPPLTPTHLCSKACKFGIYSKVGKYYVGDRMHSAKITSGLLYEVYITTRNISFAECNFLCRGIKVGHSATIYTRQRRLCRVSGTRQSQTLGKDPFCRVSGTRQTLALGKKRRQVTAAACHTGLPSASG